MASTSNDLKETYFFENIRHFPSVINGRINIVKFLEASSDLITILERLGKVFAPVKYDMQGNIDKIRKNYKYNEDSCLLELMIDEISQRKHVVAEGILWLNRALLFFEIVFQEILVCLQTKNYDASMKNIFTVAYEGSVKIYHGWVTQQIFILICKMSPTLPQIMKSFEVDHDVKSFETKLLNFNITLHLVRCKIDDFFKDNELFYECNKF